MHLSYVAIIHIYVVIDRQLQESQQRRSPLTQLAFHTVFKCPLTQKSSGVRSGERGNHAIGPPQPMQCSLNVP